MHCCTELTVLKQQWLTLKSFCFSPTLSSRLEYKKLGGCWYFLLSSCYTLSFSNETELNFSSTVQLYSSYLCTRHYLEQCQSLDSVVLSKNVCWREQWQKKKGFYPLKKGLRWATSLNHFLLSSCNCNAQKMKL